MDRIQIPRICGSKPGKILIMKEQRFFYVALLLTPFNTGKFIRMVTGYKYNHAAISLSPDMKMLYSFSRHYKDAPFYAGFTKESILRYKHNGEIAFMQICAVPVSEEQYQGAKKHFEYLEKHSEEQIYNLISAACFPFRKRIKIKNSYTCVEFVLSMLKKYTDISVLKTKEYCSIKELAEILSEYKIYEGSAEMYLENAGWEDDTFCIEKGKDFYIKNTVKNNAELIKRFFKKSL